MAEREFNNVFLSDTESLLKYTSKQRGGSSSSIPDRQRQSHGERLKSKLNTIWESEEIGASAVSVKERHGTYVEFISELGFDLCTKSLEDKKAKIKLLNIRTETVDEDNTITKATVFIPNGKENHFIKKIDDYLTKTTKKDKPQNNPLIGSISDIKRAVVKSFWIGKTEWMPSEDKLWCEVWLNSETEETQAEFGEICQSLDIEIKSERISFPERSVVVCKSNNLDLQRLIESCSSITEFRRATETATFFIELNNVEQTEWVEDLLSRMNHDNPNNVHISILDTGVNNGHVLLNPVLDDSDCVSYDSAWGSADHKGHGTSMAGLCTFGDIQRVLANARMIDINHSLESAKILPPTGENEGHLYGAITIDSISKLMIDNPDRTRIICMAITAPKYETGDGSPSSWSAAIDELTSGYIDDVKKLFFISAGNISTDDIVDYPVSNIVNTVQNPGQSWNAITVGAYTRLDQLDPDKYGSINPVATKGQISPYSSTSSLWDKKWPIKPEIVLEGGNVVHDGMRCYSCEDLSILTTYYKPHISQFELFSATSAATAQASWMAARLQSEYPEAWPETIRALLIHSATWPEEIKAQFLSGTTKGDYRNLLRACGYGVPNLEVASKCAKNSVNLIIQSELQPYDKSNSRYITKDMHIHEIPWPKDVLEEMFDAPVEMRVTLSYFIEPGPGEIGWKDRYRYPSFALRFDTNGVDTREAFYSRISRATEEDESVVSSGSIEWLLGPNNRNVGSIHSDIWRGTAAQLATSNLLGIYPKVGWWRERPHLDRWNRQVRYSLVVSLSTPVQDVDLYTPIMTEIRNRVVTTVSV